MTKKVSEVSKGSVSTKELVKFIDLLRLKGDLETKCTLLQFNKNKITVLTKNTGNTVALRGNILVDTDYTNSIFIYDLQFLKDIISTFSSDVTITNKDNKLVFTNTTGNKQQAILSIINPSNVPNLITNDKFEELLKKLTINQFVLSTSIIKQIVNCSSTIKSPTLFLTGEGKELTLSVDDSNNKLLSTFTLDKEINPFKTEVNKSIVNILSSIDSDVIVSITTNQPIYITTQTDKISFEYLISTINTTK